MWHPLSGRLLSSLFVLVLASCRPAGLDRDGVAAAIAQAAGLESFVDRGPIFDLQIYRRDHGGPGPLVIYIEGDGAAYLDPRAPSADPTPIDPLALRLAAADDGAAVVYIARPCQFAPGRSDPRCTLRDWTSDRFGAKAVQAVDAAVAREHALDPQRVLVLVGYSGGGVIAALVAARRQDVALLITVAAPLDLIDWTRRLGLSPLADAGSSRDALMALVHTLQMHYAGDADTTVPVATLRAAVDRMGPAAKARVTVVHGFDHVCCWRRDWPQLRAAALQALPSASGEAREQP